MDPSFNPDAPIYKLDRDLLWKIFSINSWYFRVANESPDADDIDSPLTITRKCSQVCSFWRDILLDSPSIWGNCINLDLLVQEGGEWCDEVLRRTGDASLFIYADMEVVAETAECELLMVLIHDHWDKIQGIDVVVESAEAIDDADFWNWLGSPAEHLRMLSIESGEPVESDESPSRIMLPPDFRLFSDCAPLLTKFSLLSYEETIIPLVTRPFPPVFLTSQLRHLLLCQFTEVPAADVLDACKQMPYLEVLGVKIARLPPATTISPSLRRVTLPRLEKLEVLADTLDVFPGFIGHLIARPGCALVVRTSFDPSEVQLPETMTANINEVRRVLSHYMNSFFDYHRDGPNSATELRLNISNTAIGFTASKAQSMMCDFRISPDYDNIQEIPYKVLGPVIDIMSSLKFPNTIVRLSLNLLDITRAEGNRVISSSTQLSVDHQHILASIFKLFSTLGSVTELEIHYSILESLVQFQRSNLALFPSLKVLHFEGLIRSQININYLALLLANRKDTAPVEIVDFTDFRMPISDLRYLDKSPGLRVIWTQGATRTEYICGSGNSKVLLIGDNSVVL